MSVKNKLDVLDFIINILMEHEKRLEYLIEKLEKNTELIQNMIKTEKLSQVAKYHTSRHLAMILMHRPCTANTATA